MKINYNPIAEGAYVCERRKILKDFGTWRKMNGEEKQFFKVCHRCPLYAKYIANEGKTPCPCLTCEHRKTEIQVDNKMTALRRKYLEEDY